MAQKDELLKEISKKYKSGEISKAEFFNILMDDPVSEPKRQSEKRINLIGDFSIVKILYILGGLIVASGIVFFVGQVWDDIGTLLRIFITFVFGFLLAISGSFLLIQKQKNSIGSVFHFIGGILIPLGVVVLLTELDSNIEINDLMFLVAFSLMFVFYAMLALFHKNSLLTVFSIFNGTVALYIFPILVGLNDYSLWYLTTAVSLLYIFLGYLFRKGFNKRIVGLLYFLGIFLFFISLAVWLFEARIFEVLYLPAIVGCLLLSKYLRSQAILFTSMTAFFGYIVYITQEHFVDSIGWPVAMVILGLILIGIGYFSITIRNRILSNI